MVLLTFAPLLSPCAANVLWAPGGCVNYALGLILVWACPFDLGRYGARGRSGSPLLLIDKFSDGLEVETVDKRLRGEGGGLGAVSPACRKAVFWSLV